MTDDVTELRIDKWLWHARFFKSRSLAAAFLRAGKLRLNSVAISKANRMVKPGDVLTFPSGPYIRVIEIVALGTRRGPAPEAQGLYTDLSPVEEQRESLKTEASQRVAPREAGTGRPTKKERRDMQRYLGDN